MDDVTANPPIDLKDPTNVRTTIEYDPETGYYTLITRLGDTSIGTPIIHP